MAKAPQWNVKGVDEVSRVVARDAAAAAGLPIGSWIDRAVKRAAAAQQKVAPPPVEPEVALEDPAVEYTADIRPAEPDPSSYEAPSVGSAPELPPDRIPRSAGEGIGRSARIGVAVAIMVALTGGAVWFLNEQMQPPKTSAKPAPVQTASAPAAVTKVEPTASQAASATASAAPTPEPTALDVLRQAAQAGDARAQYDLAVDYAMGRDVAKDDEQAARWFERAAVQGMASAQYNLGVLYDRGVGVKEDPTLAFFWFQSAAEQGHARAEHNLAAAYANGKGTNRDLAEAAKWFEKAAASGVPDSRYYLGVMYERGMGVPQDLGRAAAMYRAAADQGHKEAAERLVALGATASAQTANAKVSQTEDLTTGNADMPRAAVAEIQRLLARLDFDPGPADGVMGKKTVDAIAKYQAMAGMTADGRPSASLLEDLREVAGAATR
jgi:localization factor PodJL